MGSSCELRTLAVIPARFASTRFPGKPLADLCGRPLIQWTYEAAAASGVNDVVVETDDARIIKAVQAFGGEVIMTRADHETGTDRIAEVALARGVDVVVNVQGDEPLIPPAVIDRLVALVATDTNTDMATAAVPFSISGADPADANAVKVVLGQEQQALYFSRAAIPFCRDGDAQVAPLHHWGIYAYRREFLKRFVSWAPTALERCEKLEQLRALEHGARIRVLVAEQSVQGVDTPEDLEAVARRVSQSLQQ